MSNWFQKCFRQGFKNIGNAPFIAEFDARKLVKYWKDAHADLVYMDAITQSCTLFPTPHSEMASNLCHRNLMKQFTDACTEFDIRCGVYVTPLEHTPFTAGHDDWCQTQTNGSRHDGPSWAGDNWYWACWNSPFLDRMCELLRDLFERYPRIELLQYDGLLSRWGVCHCPACKQKYRDEFGRELPATHDRRDENFRNYVAWKFRTLTEAARKLNAAIRHKNPEVIIDTNTPAAWCGWCAVQPEDFLDEVAEACVETFPGFHSVTMPGYVHSSSVGTTAYSINYTRSQMTGSPKVVAYYAIGDCTGYTAANIDIDVMLELKSAMAFGGLVNLQFEQPAVKPTFEYIGRCQPCLVDTTPLPWCAMAASQISCDTQHGDKMQDYFEDLKGSFQALMDAHLPVEFVSGKGLATGPLDPYAVMVLSDVGYVRAAQADRIRRFVADGGGLVATHRSSLIGEDGLAREDFLLADVLGVHVAPRPIGKPARSGRDKPGAPTCILSPVSPGGATSRALVGSGGRRRAFRPHTLGVLAVGPGLSRAVPAGAGRRRLARAGLDQAAARTGRQGASPAGDRGTRLRQGQGHLRRAADWAKIRPLPAGALAAIAGARGARKWPVGHRRWKWKRRCASAPPHGTSPRRTAGSCT